MGNANDLLLDAGIRHNIFVQRFGAGVTNRIVALLKRADADVVRIIQERGIDQTWTLQRLESLLAEIRVMITQATGQLESSLNAELAGFAANEVEFQTESLTRAVGVDIGIAAPTPNQVYAAALSRPFQGRLLSETYQRFDENKKRRLRDAIRLGVVEGESNQQITRRVRDVLGVTYRDAEAIARTAVGHVAQTARMETFRQNEELVKGLVWNSTLDGRTTVNICAPRDNTKWTIEGKPIGHNMAWLGGPGRAHFRCRSTAIPWLKSWKELGLDLEEAPESTRASFRSTVSSQQLTGQLRKQGFSATEIRTIKERLSGQVSAGTTYGSWLKRQPASFQDEVLGPARGKLFRQGDLPIEKFSDRRGNELTLDELRRKEREAWEKAGLEE